MNERRRMVITYTVYLFIFSTLVGLGGHYLEYGWNPGVGLIGKISFVFMFCASGFATVILFIGLWQGEK